MWRWWMNSSPPTAKRRRPDLRHGSRVSRTTLSDPAAPWAAGFRFAGPPYRRGTWLPVERAEADVASYYPQTARNWPPSRRGNCDIGATAADLSNVSLSIAT